MKFFATLLISIAALSIPAHADVQSRMDNFFGELTAAVNVTPPTAFQGQATGHYTLGNVFYRGDQRFTNFSNIQLPGVRAGCGGIDMFAGSFSHINASEMVAVLKAIANNAVAFAFQIALETVSPVIAEKIQELQDLVTKINNFAMASCEEAQAMVGSMWPRTERASAFLCERIGTSQGLFSDTARARHGCGSEGQRAATIDQGSPEFKKMVPGNKTWKALSEHPFFDSDNAFKQFIMTIAGTAIYVMPDNDDEPGDYRIIPGDPLDNGLLGKLMDGGEVRYHQCDELDDCLNPNLFSSTATINNGLKERIYNRLSGIIDDVASDTPISIENQRFFTLIGFPIYKMISVYTQYDVRLAKQAVSAYSEVIAIDLLYTMFEDWMTAARQGAANVQDTDQESLQDWISSLDNNLRVLRDARLEAGERNQQIFNSIRHIQLVEKLVSANMTARLGSHMTLSN